MLHITLKAVIEADCTLEVPDHVGAYDVHRVLTERCDLRELLEENCMLDAFGDPDYVEFDVSETDEKQKEHQAWNEELEIALKNDGIKLE